MLCRKVFTVWDGVESLEKHLPQATEASALAGLLPHEFPPARFPEFCAGGGGMIS